ncbi:hypothetical protein GCM10017691_51570 [Pseudonocardia petroleophila]
MIRDTLVPTPPGPEGPTVTAFTLLVVVLVAALVVPFVWMEVPAAVHRRWTARRGGGPIDRTPTGGGTATG